jgi:hypothetical protein
LRAFLRFYELTGDQRYRPLVEGAIDRFWMDIVKSGPGATGGAWYMGIYARSIMLGWQITGDERLRDMAIGIAEWGPQYEISDKGYTYKALDNRWSMEPSQRGGRTPWSNLYWVDVHGFAYDQTGDPFQKKMVDKCHEWAGVAGEFQQFCLPTAERWVRTPRADTTAPAAVSDLKAGPIGDGKVNLTWTASGDDGDKGRAAVYQIKFSADKPILDFVPWPENRDTHIAFWGATNIADEPAPADAGNTESHTISGLKPGKYHFALKVRDELNNESDVSNVVEMELK